MLKFYKKAPNFARNIKLHLGFENENIETTRRKDIDKEDYRKILIKQMEVNKYTKEKLKEKIIEDEIKAEIKFDKNKGTLNKKLINFKFQKDLNKQDFNQQNSFNYNKKNIFKPINEDEKKFISNPTIRLKRTPIGGEKPTLELPFEKNYSYNNKQMMQVQNTQPHNNRENNNLKYQPYTMIEKSNYMLKELEEIKVNLDFKLYSNLISVLLEIANIESYAKNKQEFSSQRS